MNVERIVYNYRFIANSSGTGESATGVTLRFIVAGAEAMQPTLTLKVKDLCHCGGIWHVGFVCASAR